MGSPSLIDAQGDRVLSLLNALSAWHKNHVHGGVITDGGTTQGSGASTAPNVDIDVAIVTDASIGGTPLELAATADVDSDAGAGIVWGATSAVEAVGTVCLSLGSAGATPQYEIVFGAVATTAIGSVAPTDAEIDTALGHTNWIRHAQFLLTRTGDTAITVTALIHTVRPSVDYAALSTDESDWAEGGATRVFPIVQDPAPTVS